MFVEIELKFIIKHEEQIALIHYLNQQAYSVCAPVNLTNVYFETKHFQLRRCNMAMRVRSNGKQYQLTVKAAGANLAGLHQHAEYNVELKKAEPDIALLPATIWPADIDVAKLQQQLQPLFTTAYLRRCWLFKTDRSEIEVALDYGSITTETQSVPILELELELKKGEISDIFSVAETLIACADMRLGRLSKAARGYALVEQQHDTVLTAWHKPTDVDSRAFTLAKIGETIAQLLQTWQAYEDHWLSGHSGAKSSICQILAFLKQLLAYIDKPSSSPLLHKLLALRSLMAKSTDATSICFAKECVSLQTALINWIKSADAPFLLES